MLLRTRFWRQCDALKLSRALSKSPYSLSSRTSRLRRSTFAY